MDTLAFATNLVARLPLSPQQRFALGAALICEVASAANEGFPDESPFMSINIDPNEPLKTAAAALTAVDNLPAEHPLAF